MHVMFEPSFSDPHRLRCGQPTRIALSLFEASRDMPLGLIDRRSKRWRRRVTSIERAVGIGGYVEVVNFLRARYQPRKLQSNRNGSPHVPSDKQKRNLCVYHTATAEIIHRILIISSTLRSTGAYLSADGNLGIGLRPVIEYHLCDDFA